jgi:hypothetical protein
VALYMDQDLPACRCELRTERPTQATTFAQRNLVHGSQNAAPHRFSRFMKDVALYFLNVQSGKIGPRQGDRVV